MKRVLSIVLTIALLIGTFGISAFAADANSGASDANSGASGSSTPTTSTPAKTTTSTPAKTTTTVKATPVVISGDKYVVKAGDTLARIAAAAKTTVDALAKHNNIKNVNYITVGQVIYIPDASAATATAPASAATSADVTALNAKIADLEKQLAAAKAGAAAETRGQGIYEDVVATASVNMTKEADIAKSLSADGTWITTLGGDVTCTGNLVWEGDIRKGGAEGAVGRKLGIYYHSSPNIGGEEIYILKAPLLTIKADAASIQYGTFDGNIKVEANNFSLQYATVTGNIEFATQAQYDSAKFNDMKINGKVIVAGVEKSAADKPQTIVNYAKYDAAATKSDMIKASVTFKDGKPHDVYFDVLGTDYFIKEGVLSSGKQGNWGKVAYNKALQYGGPNAPFMVAATADRPQSTILRWDQQMTNLQTLYKAAGYDMSQIPLIERDATHPSVIDFNLYDGGKWAEFVNDAAPGAIDATKLSGDARVEAFEADAVTSVSVDVGKYLKAAQNIVDNFGK